jgi:hypothetical protein
MEIMDAQVSWGVPIRVRLLLSLMVLMSTICMLSVP